MDNKGLVEYVVKLYFEGYGVEEAVKIVKEKNQLDSLTMHGLLNTLGDIGGLGDGKNRKK